MSRYIDAEFEIEHYTSMTTHPTPDVTEQDKRNSLIILNALRMAKSIDIVRCGECKYYHDDYTGEWCGRFRDPHPCRADAFCSYGSRSEKPNNSTTEDCSDVGKE